jgi:AcrR family transcriptional regulator
MAIKKDARRTTAAVEGTELRERMLAALRELLDERRFESISVADVIARAGVSRASFYFYFPGKQAALAELVRRAVGQGREAATPWTDSPMAPTEALRAGVAGGADLWHDNAGVLKAIVESWGADDQLRELWLAQMALFTDAAVARIEADPVALRTLAGQDVRAVAAALSWLGERLYYLAAAGVAPFDDREVLVRTLTHAWVSALYGERSSE